MQVTAIGNVCARIMLALLVFGFVVRENAAGSCLQSSQSAWINTPMAMQTAKFTAAFDATPSQTDMDGVVGFSSSAATSYTSLAAIVRFSTAGTIDVRNGGAYAADVSLPYVASASYHIRMVIDPVAHLYNVYVTPPGSVEVALASNYAFRSEQATTSALNNWADYSDIGTMSVCNMSATIWSVAPTITQQPANLTVNAGNTAAFSVIASGAGTLSYQWKRNGTAIAGAISATYTTPATTSSDNGVQFTVVVSSSAGSVTSSAATLTVKSLSSCVTSSQSIWTNTAISTEAAQFTATFDATPSQADEDGVVGFSESQASGYTSLGVIVRFSTAGTMDVRNGGGYAAGVSLPYVGGATYHIRMVINPAANTYSVYVTPPGSVEVALATNYVFRSEQSGVSALANWSVHADIGGLSVCNMAVTTPSGSPGSVGTPDISWTPSTLSFGNVAMGGSKTMAVTLTSSGSAYMTISKVSISGAGFTASGLPTGTIMTPGQTATLDVTFAPSGTGSTTGSAVITSNASNSPTATISLAGSGAQSTTHSVALTWIASTSKVAGYNVYRGTASGGPYTRQNPSLISLLNYGDTSVVAGQTYYYLVTSVSSSNVESAYSNEVSATTP